MFYALFGVASHVFSRIIYTLLIYDPYLILPLLCDKSKHVFVLDTGLGQPMLYERLEDLVAAPSIFWEAAQLRNVCPPTALAAARQGPHQNGDLLYALDGYRTALEILPKVSTARPKHAISSESAA
jgi:hypothetical protein